MSDAHGEAYDRNENGRRPPKEGEPPRPATEPKGSEPSTREAPTATDPGTGAPRKPA